MKKTYIIGNWKTYPLQLTLDQWVEQALEQKNAIEKADKEKSRETILVACPSFSFTAKMRDVINRHEGAKNFINLGVQDVSAFAPGAHTGDEAAENLQKNFDVSYAIIGHSERRREHSERYELLKEKIKSALEADITPIFCVQTVHEEIPSEVKIVAYEPPSAISAVSGGVPANPQEVEAVAAEIRKRMHGRGQEISMLYGGSVNAENVAEFTRNNSLHSNFDGVLVGAKSITPEFFQIAINA